MFRLYMDKSFSRMFRQPPRPLTVVVQDFLKRDITLSGEAQWYLAWYPKEQYESALRVSELIKKKFNRLSIDPPEKIRGIEFDRLPERFLLEQINGNHLILADLREKLHVYWKRNKLEDHYPEELPVRPAVKPEAAPQTTVRKAARILTDDRLFDYQSGIPYPHNPEEYRALIARLVDSKGRFPGDSEPLCSGEFYAPKIPGVKHFTLNRKGKAFQVEIMAPHLYAQGVRNRLIFDADLVSQNASDWAYGTPGVSYDRESYYVRRLFNAEIVPFIKFEGMPVSFTAVQGFQTSFQEQELYYAFIHFTMTHGSYQGYGLTSYLVREGLSRLFYRDIWRNYPNLMVADDGRITDHRFRMWAFAHSGRFTPFYAFVKGLGSVGPEQRPISDAIIYDIHRRITPPKEQSTRGWPISRGIVRVNGGAFPIAVDQGVYPPNVRYPVKDGQVVFPQGELGLPSSIREAWLTAVGGEKGLSTGNSLYFGGEGNFGAILRAKSNERRREGGGLLERYGDDARQFLISREKK